MYKHKLNNYKIYSKEQNIKDKFIHLHQYQQNQQSPLILTEHLHTFLASGIPFFMTFVYISGFIFNYYLFKYCCCCGCW